MNLARSVRAYINSLVHVSARKDHLAAARHRAFIAPRLLGGALALAALPIYLLARGALGLLEAAVVAWFLTPIAIAYFLALTGRYEQAHILSSLALAALVTTIAAMTGGLASPAVIWLVLLPMEAALSVSRRVVLISTVFTLAAAATLLVLGPFASSITAAERLPLLLAGASLLSATAYAALLALGVDAQRRIGSRRRIAEEERYQLLAAHMTDVISRHQRNGVTLFVSPAAEKLCGVPAARLVGHGLFDRVHVSDRPAYLSALADAAEGRDGGAEFRLRRDPQAAGGREHPHYIWLEMRCRGFLPAETRADSDGGSEVVAVLRDVTERKRQEQRVADAHSEAEKANAAKGRFLATMSHELRTPLNAVIGFSEMLMSESALQIDAQRRLDYATLIRDSGQHLLSVVNLVLDMSKIETGNFIITPEPYAPAAVIRNCCDLLALKAHEAGLEIVARIPGDLPEMIGDKRALKQMLFNLLSNAIKFTERGGRVSVNATVEDAQFALVVEDTGVGISETDLPRLGDPFFQARNSYDRPYEGTGLGLSIVKGLVDLHGGRFEVTSRLGVGTRAAIRLPLDCEASRERHPKVVDFGQAARHELPAAAALAGVAEPEMKKRA